MWFLFFSPEPLCWIFLSKLVKFLIQVLNWLPYFICLFESTLRSLIIFKTILLNSLSNHLAISVSEELRTFEGVILPCFFHISVFSHCSLHICWDRYLFWFSIMIFIVGNLLLRSQSPLPLRGEKVDCSNNNSLKTNQTFKCSNKQFATSATSSVRIKKELAYF
jgi:hypothetical protein